MTDSIMYLKAAAVSVASIFGICVCVVGLAEAIKLFVAALGCVLMLAAFVALGLSVVVAIFGQDDEDEQADQT